MVVIFKFDLTKWCYTACITARLLESREWLKDGATSDAIVRSFCGYFQVQFDYLIRGQLAVASSDRDLGSAILNFGIQIPFRFLSTTLKTPKRIRANSRNRISMVWVPPVRFDPYCEAKWLPLQDELTPSINSKKIFLQKL